VALSDLWLSIALKKHLKGIHVTCDDEILAAMGKWFREQHNELYNNRFKNPVWCWQCCIEIGHYVEKWYRTKYIFSATFCVLFHFNTYSGCGDTNMEALLSEHYWYYCYCNNATNANIPDKTN